MSRSSGQSSGSTVDEPAIWRLATRLILFTIGALITLWLLYYLRAVVVQVLLAVIVSAGMMPIVNRVAPAVEGRPGTIRVRRLAPRILVVVLLYAILLSVIILAGAIVIPPAVHQIDELVRHLPAYAAQSQAWLEDLAERSPFIPAGIGETLRDQLSGSVVQIAGFLSQALVLFQVIFGVLGGALNAVFILFLALYLTADADRIRRYIVGFLPPHRQEQVDLVMTNIGKRLGGWVVGQITLSAIIGAMTLAGLWLIGVPYAVLLSLIAAAGEAIPMVGPIISAIPAVIVAFLQSPTQGFLTLLLYIIIQQVENAVIVPKVMERAVALHPIAVMLALLAGAELYGIAGAVLSVPVAAALSVVVTEVRREQEVRRRLSAGAAAVGVEDRGDRPAPAEVAPGTPDAPVVPAPAEEGKTPEPVRVTAPRSDPGRSMHTPPP